MCCYCFCCFLWHCCCTVSYLLRGCCWYNSSCSFLWLCRNPGSSTWLVWLNKNKFQIYRKIVKIKNAKLEKGRLLIYLPIAEYAVSLLLAYGNFILSFIYLILSNVSSRLWTGAFFVGVTFLRYSISVTKLILIWQNNRSPSSILERQMNFKKHFPALMTTCRQPLL